MSHAAVFLLAYLTSDQDPAMDNGDEKTDETELDRKDNNYCEHYKRSSCVFKFKCCEDRFFPCYNCHNEFYAQQCEESNEDSYNVIRECEHPHVASVDSIAYKCTKCESVSPTEEFSEKCMHCDTRFAAYTCIKCKQLVNDKSLDPYHCDGCNTCRVDKANSFHCYKCNICLHKNLKKSHTCLEDSGHHKCGVCLEEVFNGCLVLPCSHKIHKDCLKLLIEHKRINCPICRQCYISVDELTKQPSFFGRLRSFWCRSRNTSTAQVQEM